MLKQIFNRLLFLFIILTAGCSDIKEIQEMNYATAIGIDYRDHQYVAYVQFVSLFDVSNVEGATTKEPDIWVSQSTGNTLNNALYQLYNTAQEKVIWSHVSSIIFSEAAIENGFEGIYNGIIRYNEFRLTPWVFGTTQEMKELLSTQGFYNQSALETIMHNPENIYRQFSLIRPIALYRLAREAYEPAFTTYLPALAVNENQWVKNEKADPKLMYSGLFFIKGKEYKGFIPLNKLHGIQWITNDTERTSLTIRNEELGGEIFIVIEHQDSNVEANISGEKPTFQVNIKLEGYVSNQNEKAPLPSDIIKDEIVKSIEKDVYNLHHLGLELGADLLNFEHELFLHHTQYWKEKVKNKGLLIEEGTLENVNIEVELKNAGAGKSY